MASELCIILLLMKTISADFKTGLSSNGVPYARWGVARKVLFIINGGPGNMLPRNPGFATKTYESFIQDFSIVIVSRKTDLPESYTTEDMADDCAEMIRRDLGGKVYGAMGVSFGGMIMQHFTAKYANLAERHIIAIATNWMSGKGKEIDTRFAMLLSEGKPGRAAAALADGIVPSGPFHYLFKGFFFLMGRSLIDSSSQTFHRDILIEAKAETGHDAEDHIRKICVPVLMVCGDRDFYFPTESARKTALLNENIQLKIYEGKGHMGVLNGKQFAYDVLEFLK